MPPTREPSTHPISHSTLADTAGLDTGLRLIEGKLGPLEPGIREHLIAVEVRYFSFTDSTCSAVDKERLYSGVLIVHSCIADEVRSIFEAMRQDTFPIAKVIPINCYGLNADHTGWNDEASMADNNTSAFNYRTKPRSAEPSKHAQGVAIDINPMLNPMVRHDSTGTTVEPAMGRYDAKGPGTLTRTNTQKYLRALGWSWGGRWPRPQDHQHIEKSRGSCAHMRFSLN
ncbi:MAG: M15 family metallopeptidase [Flavobacteriales bacterium]|nr:M15 family metallopeptidase [Flavobacteriales bacterium]